MNRLILLGNGFDLAHGMKTSYNNFIIWYLTSSMKEAREKGEYHDGLISVQYNRLDLNPSPLDLDEYVNHFYCNGGLQPFFAEQGISYTKNGCTYENTFRISVHTEFMKLLFNECNIQNWVDIENKYYQTLTKVLGVRISGMSDNELIESLNKTMEILTKNLERFLKTQDAKDIAHDYDGILTQPLAENEFVHWDQVEVKELEQTLILNFNYTSTIDYYINPDRNVNHSAKVNYIHGELSRSKNPMIFGFGDELDASYKKLEDRQTKGLFKHIKSFWYFKTRNYHDLIRYLASGQYQVFILGHSCGLSDRTMLNMIFEHDNCLSIKIYYHQINDAMNNYTELTEEISRHFKSKTKMRERIVSFEDSKRMPQVW